jgi:hypothetical protein
MRGWRRRFGGLTYRRGSLLRVDSERALSEIAGLAYALVGLLASGTLVAVSFGKNKLRALVAGVLCTAIVLLTPLVIFGPDGAYELLGPGLGYSAVMAILYPAAVGIRALFKSGPPR